ncbi:SGNH/GDSL hydrolase family protein [Tamlana sp. I1]|uniref:SGNH/GDSL hydrolase family protein n=1 Tax=Tamlana sp. I1 TaxID=2762061 RepID=UPI00188F7012|nr:SGNH/GDSL hydrolase family protein [Tamlana sp. I1]
MNLNYISILLIALLFNCREASTTAESTETDKTTPTKYEANNENFQYFGRHEFLEKKVALISPAAYVSINFEGDVCHVYLQAEQVPYNYVSFELDGKYLGRIKIDSQAMKPYKIEVPSNSKQHHLRIFKESEVFNGPVLFEGIQVVSVLPKSKDAKYYIEFIGDSITCGAASDGSTTPCDEGEYFDHENAYYSYGSNVSKALNANFALSSVSGIGMYRNWNDENSEEPIMPEVYENLYLNKNQSKKYDFKKQPDIVSIGLGTNDFSNGDGIKPRLPFNEAKYISNYIAFIKTVYSKYPDTQIVLLNSPMIGGNDNKRLVSYLKEVQSHFTSKAKKPVIFEFQQTYMNGCAYHPSVNEHKTMASNLTPFLKNLLD